MVRWSLRLSAHVRRLLTKLSGHVRWLLDGRLLVRQSFESLDLLKDKYILATLSQILFLQLVKFLVDHIIWRLTREPILWRNDVALAHHISCLSWSYALGPTCIVVVLLGHSQIHVVLHLRRSAHSLFAGLEQVHFELLDPDGICSNGLLLSLRDLNEVAVIVGWLLGRDSSRSTRQLPVAPVLVSFPKNIVSNPPTCLIFSKGRDIAILNLLEVVHYILFFFF